MESSFNIDNGPSIDEIDVVARLHDPVKRNHQITHAYHRLALALARKTGKGANWCAFAVWASRQAGQTIRGEDLLRALEQTLRLRPEVVSGFNVIWRKAILKALARPGSQRARMVKALGQDAFARAGEAVARGNLKVFDEIGRLFARFLSICPDGCPPEADLQTFVAGMRPGDPPEGQALLIGAFQAYASAMASTDDQERAELMLLANLRVGLHEQTRLQPEILAALEVPSMTLMALGRRLLSVLFPSSPGWFGALRGPMALVAGSIGRGGEAALRALLRETITESLMTLSFPDATIRLGKDLSGEVPAMLASPRNPELRALLDRFRPRPNDRDGYGTDDWSDLPQRMTLIARLFLIRHEDRILFEKP